MGFETTTLQNTTPENKQDPIKKEQGFLDNNPEIKSIYDNTIKKYPNIDSENFEQITKNISDKVSKENIIKYFPNILDDLLTNDKDFLNGESNTISIIIIKELNGYIKIEKDKVTKSAKEEKNKAKEEKNKAKEEKNKAKEEKNKAKEEKNKAKEEKNKTKEGQKLNIENQQKTLSDLYKTIPDTFKQENNKPDFDNFKNQNISKVKDKLTGTSITLDEYLTHRYTAQQLYKSGETIPNKYEFIKSFNQLNKLLDIDIQIPLIPEEKVNYKPLPDSLNDFQSKPDKILALDTIQDYIKKSPDTIQDTHIPDQDIIKLYSDGIPDAITEILSKNNLDPSLIKYFDIENYDTKTGILDKKSIKEIPDDKLLNQLQQISQAVSEKFIKQGKEEISKITNKIIKEKIMTSIFRGVSDFFDITNDNVENFANDFKLDFNQDLNFANNIVNIQGQINGSHIGLHYDLVLGKLSIDDVISFDPKNKLYRIGKQSGSVLDIPIKLPKLKDFQDDALQFDYKNLAKESDNYDQYQSNLNKQLGSVFYGNFIHKELNQYYIRRLNEKNLAVQSGLSYMLNNFRSSVGPDSSFDFDGLESSSFTEDLNSDHFRLIKMLDDSFDYYNRSNDFLKIRNLFEKFNMLINSSKVKDGNASEKLIDILFNSAAMKTSASSWQSMGNNGNFNYLRFYDLIGKSRSGKNIIDINLLENVVDILGNGEQFSDKDNKKKFNSSFWNKYEKIVNDPDEYLENNLNEI
ncbi:MAG: hypothetical protein WAZ12_01025 [Candidatus Absconditicoccaceae bacterium]